jgi:hypothetical protein
MNGVIKINNKNSQTSESVPFKTQKSPNLTAYFIQGSTITKESREDVARWIMREMITNKRNKEQMKNNAI